MKHRSIIKKLAPCKCSTNLFRRRASVCVLWCFFGYPRPSLAGIGVPLGIDRAMCLDAQGGIKAQRQPFVVGVVVNILSTVGTENTYTPARLEALFKSSQSSPFVPSRIRSPSFLASDCVVNRFRCFVKRSAVLFFVPRGSFCTSPLYRSCATWQEWFSSFFVSMRSVFHSKFPCPRSSQSCTSS